MDGHFSEQTIIDALQQLPPDRWDAVLTFIESLRPAQVPSRGAPINTQPMTAADLLESDLVGIWSERSDIGDSRDFARRLREQAQTQSGG